MNSKSFISKWMMRVRQASAQLKIAFWGVTAVSTMVTALKGTRFSNYTTVAALTFLVGSIVFTYMYDKLRIMNLQNRWSVDRANNFINPGQAMQQMIRAKQFAVLSESIKQDWSKEETWTAMEAATKNSIQDYANGIDMEEFR